MKTDDLIDTLADRAGAASPPDARVVLAPLAGVVATAMLFFVFYGFRPELAAQLARLVVAAKTLLPLVLAALALPLALRSIRPGAGAGISGWAIWLVPIAAAVIFAGAFAGAPPDARLSLFLGHSIAVCLPSIPTLSVPVLAGLLWTMRRGAPVHPVRAGLLAGLVAGGAGAAFYSLFCVEDSPLFYAVWYSGGILLAALLGAFTGRRVLRW